MPVRRPVCLRSLPPTAGFGVTDHGRARPVVGRRQLVALTRALIARPRILLLDEPTASMDRTLESTILDALVRSQEPGVTVVTHKTSVVDYCDRVIVLDGGRVVLDGPRAQVIEALSGPKRGED